MRKRQAKKIECKYWSVCEYAQIIGVCDETVRRMIRSGELQAVRIGGCWRIPK